MRHSWQGAKPEPILDHVGQPNRHSYAIGYLERPEATLGPVYLLKAKPFASGLFDRY